MCTAQHKYGFCKQRYTTAECGRSRFTWHYDHCKSISVPGRQKNKNVYSRTVRVPQNNFEGHSASCCAHFNLYKLERHNTNAYFTLFLFCSSQFQLLLYIYMTTCLQPGVPRCRLGRPRDFILYNGACHFQHKYCSFYFTCVQK